jgi:hypothetical protein
MLVLRDLLTFLFDIAGGKSKADAQFFQPFSGTGTRFAGVHWRESYASNAFMSSYVTLL